MSGFLPDLASWALGGGAAAPNDDNNNDDEGGGDGDNNEPAAPAVSGDEMRAKRMARLAALEKKDSAAAASGNGAEAGSDAPSNMDVDKGDAQPMEVDEVAEPATVAVAKDDDATMEPAPKKKIKSPASSAAVTSDPRAKLRRKKALLLRRVLLVTFGTSPSDRTPSCVHLVLDDDDIYSPEKNPAGVRVRHVAELLAARLSLSPSSRSLETAPSQVKLGLVSYLGGCHKRAGEELKEVRNKIKSGGEKKKADDGAEELCGILEEIRNQVSRDNSMSPRMHVVASFLSRCIYGLIVRSMLPGFDLITKNKIASFQNISDASTKHATLSNYNRS